MTKQTSQLDLQDNAQIVLPVCIPMTPTQIGMIYESVLADQPRVNLEQIVCRLNDESVNVEAMEQAWQRMIARHAILRSVFDWQAAATPQMQVLESVPLLLEHVDLSRQAPTQQQEQIDNWLECDREQAVDLSRPGNWRLTWFQLGPRQSVLVWTFHHAMLDGRSFTMLLQEALDCYSAKTRGFAEKTETACPPAFADHCLALARQDHSSGLQHFAKHLKGFDQANRIDLGDRPEATKPRRKHQIDRQVPPAFAKDLIAKAEAADVTVATLVMAAWGIVVARCSNSLEAVIGVTRSGRHLVPRANEMAGCLINTLPQRISLQETQTIDALLHHVRRDQIELRPYEQTPLAEISSVSELPAGEALFQSAVIFERASLGESLRRNGGAWENRQIEVLEEGALPLTLAVYQDASMLFRLEYAPEQYSATCADRLMGYTLELLRSIAHCPGDTKLAELNMLPKAEQSRLLDLAQDASGAASQKTLHSVSAAFREQVRKAPTATAVVDQTSAECLSYQQLDKGAGDWPKIGRTWCDFR